MSQQSNESAPPAALLTPPQVEALFQFVESDEHSVEERRAAARELRGHFERQDARRCEAMRKASLMTQAPSEGQRYFSPYHTTLLQAIHDTLESARAPGAAPGDVSASGPSPLRPPERVEELREHAVQLGLDVAKRTIILLKSDLQKEQARCTGARRKAQATIAELRRERMAVVSRLQAPAAAARQRFFLEKAMGGPMMLCLNENHARERVRAEETIQGLQMTTRIMREALTHFSQSLDVAEERATGGRRILQALAGCVRVLIGMGAMKESEREEVLKLAQQADTLCTELDADYSGTTDGQRYRMADARGRDVASLALEASGLDAVSFLALPEAEQAAWKARGQRVAKYTLEGTSSRPQPAHIMVKSKGTESGGNG